ncbi:MAG: hypothetical protein ACKOC5_06785 [Chloroflexota bacterium]
MQELESHRRLPGAERLSLLSASVLLAYAVARFIDLPGLQLAAQLPGVYLAVEIDVETIIAFLVAGLTASGTAWLVRDHPGLGRRSPLEHLLLPALTAWAVSLPLSQMAIQPFWWLAFSLSGLLLILVMVAEYITVDYQDDRRPLAAAGLTAVSFTLFLVLAAGLRFAGLRLFQLLPAVALACGLLSLRALRLRFPQRWSPFEAGLVLLVTVQLAAGLHYWPVTPVSFGLALLGPAYALTALLGNLAEGEPLRQALLEPVVVLLIILGAAVWMR